MNFALSGAAKDLRGAATRQWKQPRPFPQVIRNETGKALVEKIVFSVFAPCTEINYNALVIKEGALKRT